MLGARLCCQSAPSRGGSQRRRARAVARALHWLCSCGRTSRAAGASRGADAQHAGARGRGRRAVRQRRDLPGLPGHGSTCRQISCAKAVLPRTRSCSEPPFAVRLACCAPSVGPTCCPAFVSVACKQLASSRKAIVSRKHLPSGSHLAALHLSNQHQGRRCNEASRPRLVPRHRKPTDGRRCHGTLRGSAHSSYDTRRGGWGGGRRRGRQRALRDNV